jgi:hypothetical protein
MILEFTGYAGDCYVTGLLDTPGNERLSDLLNRQEEVTLRQVAVVSHADARVIELDELSLEPGELYAVTAMDAGSSASKRIHTVRHRLEVRAGPYAILGHLHALPGGQPLVSIGRRPPLVPLTGATIAFSHDGHVEVRDVTTLIVNRNLADWCRADPDELTVFMGETVAAVGA